MGFLVTVHCDRPGCHSTINTGIPSLYGGIESWIESEGWRNPDGERNRYICTLCQKGRPFDQAKIISGAKMLIDFLRELDGQGFYLTACPDQSTSRSPFSMGHDHPTDCRWHVHNSDYDVNEGVRAHVTQEGRTTFASTVAAPNGQVLIQWDDEVWE
jgi:hypothetical protein